MKVEDFNISEEDTIPQVFDKIKEKLGISEEVLVKRLNASLSESAEKLSLQINFVAPFNDYSKLLDDPITIESLLKEISDKPDHWNLNAIVPINDKPLMQFVFTSSAVEDLEGFVVVNDFGKIKHSFVQYNY